MKIEGHTFLVTGGASGLGEAVVRHFISLGANVLICDMNDEAGKSLQTELGERSMYFSCNVCDEQSVVKSIQGALKQFGKLHGVIQCAGIGNPRRVISSSGTVHSLKDFQQIINVNLNGTFNVLRLAASVMSKQEPEDSERGVIINVASVAAFDGQIGQAAYSASKGAIVAMTLPIARELADLGIRVLTIAPGLFNTPMMARLPAPARASLAKQVPYPRRLGEPREFASLAAHLVSNQYLNAEVVRIDGAIRMAAM